MENTDVTWGEYLSTFQWWPELAAARQKTIIRMCRDYIAATGIFPLWLAERFPPKISNRMMLPFISEAVKSKLEFSPSSCGQNGQGWGQNAINFCWFSVKTFLETHLLNICLQVRKSETCSQKCQEQGTALTPRVQSPHKKNEVTTIQSVTGFFLIDLKHQNKTSTQIDSDFYSHFCPCFFGGVGGRFLPKISSSESLICKQTVKSVTAKGTNSREGKSTFCHDQESKTSVLFYSQCVLPVHL